MSGKSRDTNQAKDSLTYVKLKSGEDCEAAAATSEKCEKVKQPHNNDEHNTSPDGVIENCSRSSVPASCVDSICLNKDSQNGIVMPNNQSTCREEETNLWANFKKFIWGLIIVCGIATSWVGSTQLATETYDPNFNAPFFLVWFSTSWMIVCFPIYMIVVLLYEIFSATPERQAPTEIISKALLVYGPHGITALTFVTRCASFTILWVASNVMYLCALGINGINPADVTALFASNCCFIYLLSWVILKDKFVSLRMVAVAVSTAGVVLFAAFTGVAPWSGYCLAVAAAMASALYQVYLKYVFMSSGGGLDQTALFLSMVGVTNLCLMAPVTLALRLTHTELYELSTMPWLFILGMSALFLVFNFLVNFGIVLTFPLFIALGVFVGIPLNAATDAMFRGVVFEPLKIVGTVLIMLGFLMVLAPPDWNERLAKLCPCFHVNDHHYHMSEQEKQANKSVRTLLKQQ